MKGIAANLLCMATGAAEKNTAMKTGYPEIIYSEIFNGYLQGLCTLILQSVSNSSDRCRNGIYGVGASMYTADHNVMTIQLS